MRYDIAGNTRNNPDGRRDGLSHEMYRARGHARDRACPQPTGPTDTGSARPTRMPTVTRGSVVAGQDLGDVRVGTATSQGRRAHNADAAALCRVPSTDVVAAALADGMYSTADVAETAYLAVQVAARVGARKGALAGLLAAAELVAEPTVEFPDPDGALVLAVARPHQPVVITYVGDCRAYGYSDGRLYPLTVDHTKGVRLRHEGVAESDAARYDSVPTTSFGRATVATVALVETDHPIVVLTTDGVHTVLSHERLEGIVAGYMTTGPAACASALVDAARRASPNDDATAVVLTRPPAAEHPDYREGR